MAYRYEEAPLTGSSDRAPRWGTPETLVQERPPRFKGTLVDDWSNGEGSELWRQAPRVEKIGSEWVKVPEDFDMANVSNGRVENGAWVPNALEWKDVPARAAQNFLPSTLKLVKELASAVYHYDDTAKGIGRLVAGVASKAGVGDFDESTADAFGNIFVDKYGGIENLKKTMATDPAGFLSDLSMLMTGGAMAGAKVGGTVGKIALAADKAAGWIDPLTATVKTGGAVLNFGGHAAARALGVTTGAGGDAIVEMQRAGRAGNADAIAQARDTVPASVLVDKVHDGLGDVLKDRKADYDADMAPVKASTATLSFREPAKALVRGQRETQHKGVVIDSEAADAVMRMRNLMKQFAQNGMNSPYDLNRLNVGVNAIRGTYHQGTNARRIVDSVASSIGDTIASAVPEYRAAQSNYAARSGEVSEIRKTLSASDRASLDTQLRKILSLKRSNVNTNFGARRAAAEPIFQRRPNLEGMIAGRVLSGWEPQGLARAATAFGLGVAGPTGAMLLNPASLAAVGGLAAASPRAVAEAAYKIGQARRIADKLPLSPSQRRLIRQVTARTDAVNDDKRPYRTK